MVKDIMNEENVEVAEDELRYIDFVWNGSRYIMEFNRETATYVEDSLGINVIEMLRTNTVPLMKLPYLFHASLMMHHRKMKIETANAILAELGDKLELMHALIELYSRAVNSVFEEPEEGKALTWTRH